MAVRFTQFLFPTGTKKPVEIDLDAETERRAQALLAAGALFEIECHPDTQTVYMDITSNNGDMLWANNICQNGPGLPPAVKTMIDRAYAKLIASQAKPNQETQ